MVDCPTQISSLISGHMDFKDLLDEIRAFVSCPSIIRPLDEDEDEVIFTDHEIVATSMITEIEDDEEEEEDNDDELARQLNSQLFGVLIGATGSSVCDSESLEPSEFSSDDDLSDDDFDKIVQQLHDQGTLGEEEKCSMPTLSSLLTCESNNNELHSFDHSLTNDSDQIRANNSKSTKSNLKKFKSKFAQHQTKVNYAFNNESSIRLFDKIIRNNIQQKMKASLILLNTSHASTSTITTTTIAKCTSPKSQSTNKNTCLSTCQTNNLASISESNESNNRLAIQCSSNLDKKTKSSTNHSSGRSPFHSMIASKTKDSRKSSNRIMISLTANVSSSDHIVRSQVNEHDQNTRNLNKRDEKHDHMKNKPSNRSNKKVPRKSKSEILTLNSSPMGISIESLLNSIKSK